MRRKYMHCVKALFLKSQILYIGYCICFKNHKVEGKFGFLAIQPQILAGKVLDENRTNSVFVVSNFALAAASYIYLTGEGED